MSSVVLNVHDASCVKKHTFRRLSTGPTTSRVRGVGGKDITIQGRGGTGGKPGVLFPSDRGSIASNLVG